MTRLHNLSYKNKETQAKVNFFLDYFLFVNYRIGKDDLFTIETPLSIFENILIQLEENDLRNVPKYFEKYISNSLITNYTFIAGKENVADFNTLVASYNHYAENEKNKNKSKENTTPIKLIKKIKSIFKIKKKRKKLNRKQKWLKKKKTTLIELIKKIIDELREELFKEYVKNVRTFLFCSHKLDEHLECIKWLTQLIISDFLLNGFTKEDIDKYFKGKDIYKAICTPSLKKEEFAGIVDFRFKIRTANFLFKLNGISLGEEDSDEIGSVFIDSCLSKKFSKLYTEDNGRKQLFLGDEYVDSNTFAIIGIEQNYRGPKYAKEQAILKINPIIKDINTLGYDCTLDEKKSIITSDFEGYLIESSFVEKKYNKERFSELQYDYESSDAVEELSKFDHLYESLNNNDIEKYWHYLEVLYKSTSASKGSNTGKVIECTSKILLHEYDRKNQCLWLRYYIFFRLNPNKKILGYTYDEIKEISNQVPNFDIEGMKKRVTNPFILDLLNLINIIESPKSQDDYKEVYTYYKNTLWELYEYRNHYIHVGKKIENIAIKMGSVMPILISKFRRTILREANTNPKKSLGQIMQSLEGKAVTKFKIS